MNVEAEIRERKRRVSEIEGSFEFLTHQIKSVHKDMLAFQTRTEQKFEELGGHLGRVDGRLDRLEKGVRSLHDDMPGILGRAMREVQRERSQMPRKSP